MYNQLQSLTIMYNSQYNSCMRLKGAPLRVLWPLCILKQYAGGKGGAVELRCKYSESRMFQTCSDKIDTLKNAIFSEL